MNFSAAIDSVRRRGAKSTIQILGSFFPFFFTDFVCLPGERKEENFVFLPPAHTQQKSADDSSSSSVAHSHNVNRREDVLCAVRVRI